MTHQDRNSKNKLSLRYEQLQSTKPLASMLQRQEKAYNQQTKRRIHEWFLSHPSIIAKGSISCSATHPTLALVCQCIQLPLKVLHTFPYEISTTRELLAILRLQYPPDHFIYPDTYALYHD